MLNDKINIEIIIQEILYSKYNDSKEEFDKQFIYCLQNSKKCHFSAKFKDYLIYDYIDEFFKNKYTLNESLNKLPKIALYYKSYLSFFCRPFFKNFYLNNLIQNYYDTKAEIFYKETYENKNNQILKRKKKDLNNNFNNIIFDSKTKKIIENSNLLTTIDLNNDNLKSSEDFFTIKTQNDGLIDILNNLTINSINDPLKKKKIEIKENIKKNESSISTNNKTIKKSIDNINNNINNMNKIKLTKTNSIDKKEPDFIFSKSPKRGLFNLYKKHKVEKETNFANVNSLGNINSPKFSSCSNLAQFKKCKPIKKSKNSFINSNLTNYQKKNLNNNIKNSKMKISYSRSNINYSKTILENKKNNRTNSFSKSNKSNDKKDKNSLKKNNNQKLINNYLLNCLSSHVNNNLIKSKNNKINKIKQNFKYSIDLKSKSNLNLFSVRNNKNNNSKPLNINYMNSIPKKNIFQNSKINNNTLSKNKKIITKNNKSVETLNKNLNNNNNIFKEKIKEDDYNINNNININKNSSNYSLLNNSFHKLKNQKSIIKNKSNPKLIKNNNKSCYNTSGENKIKNLNRDLEKLINKIKINLNSNRYINGLLSAKNKPSQISSNLLKFEYLVPNCNLKNINFIKNNKSINLKETSRGNNIKNKSKEMSLFSSREESIKKNKKNNYFNSSAK